VMRFRSEGDAVPMLCPGCCTIDDIPDWTEDSTGDLRILVGCRRCGFTFPILPGEFKGLTLRAMYNHDCRVPEGAWRGDWAALGNAILDGMTGRGDYPELPEFPPASRFTAGGESLKGRPAPACRPGS
jgi:hypothetical protein